jgi:hypothetical protein
MPQSGTEVQPGASARTAQAQAVLATAAAYQAEQEAETQRLVAAVLVLWASMDAKKAFESWARIGTRIFVLLSSLMELVAADASGYVRQVLTDQDVEHNGPAINPVAFAGIASDGRDLESLLAGALVKLREAQRRGLSDAQAKMAGRNFLELVVRTQVSDAARAAESVGVAVAEPTKGGKKVAVGYVRMLTPPSCSRCVVLAGKFYRWNSGFERHPNCDCRHIPVTVAGANELLTNPYVYFNSLTEAEQDYYFGKANAQAIRDGADLNQVVNSGKSGMVTADGGRRYVAAPRGTRGALDLAGLKGLRPTVWQIYRDAAGNREKAKDLLYRYGYTLSR